MGLLLELQQLQQAHIELAGPNGLLACAPFQRIVDDDQGFDQLACCLRFGQFALGRRLKGRCVCRLRQQVVDGKLQALFQQRAIRQGFGSNDRCWCGDRRWRRTGHQQGRAKQQGAEPKGRKAGGLFYRHDFASSCLSEFESSSPSDERMS